MTYSAYGLIQASDFNTFVGNATQSISTANTLNTVWGIGFGNAGYGQTGVPEVPVGNLVRATDWANLINTMNSSIAPHQGSTVTNITVPSSGDLVSTISAVSTNLSTIYTNRLNAVGQGSTTSNTAVTVSSWSSQATFTHTITFQGGNQARYFFNAGGQLVINMNHPIGTGINGMFNNMATSVGTLYISSPVSTNTASIAGTSFRGVTQIGGGTGRLSIDQTKGYYALTTTNAEVFKQGTNSSPVGYSSSYISVNVRTNGTQTTNGDAGTVITITTVWDEVPNGLIVSAGSSVTVGVKPPTTSYLNPSWGNITVVGSVTAT